MGVRTFRGVCTFLDAGTIRCGEEEIKAKRFLIAAGGEPVPVLVPGGEYALTSDDFLYLDELPEHIAFIGGGYISMEFAFISAAAGE